ncbi:MAG TPA: hypothetical protein VL588_06785 [Bdellovibrionota bacterium]|nr:hypothetical protein [Bdellovibrionota bacterium]
MVQPQGRLRIGEFLVEKGVLTPDDVENILKYSRHAGLRFGEAGMEMGLITREALIKVFGPSFRTDFFHLQPQYFPMATKDLVPVETILKLGVLPLAFKTEYKMFRARKRLNLGMLDPTHSAALDQIQALVGGQFASIKVFLVLADQFLEVVRQVYGVTQDRLRSMRSDEIHERLQMFLEMAP